MLGDTAVAVHPEDARYRGLIGSHAILPLVGRRMPIVADEYADPEQGSGAVKITPAHDFNDFEVGRRHDLDVVNVFDAEARINENAPGAYQGLDRMEARERVLADLEAQGLIEAIEAYVHTVPHGDRSGAVIEPWLTDQWYVDAKTLAKPAIEAVEDGRIRFVPERWTSTYFEWMRNIQPWCVSRQLWWGHRIPAWYGPDGHVFVATSEAEAEEQAAPALRQGGTAEPRRGRAGYLVQLGPLALLDPRLARAHRRARDLLPQQRPDHGLRHHLLLGRPHGDARHALHGRYPLPHGLHPRAGARREGAEMSKSKGNVIDPLALIDKYGADALRFTLAAMEAQGRDIKLAESRVAGYRNFATKALECGALLRGQRMRAGPRLRSRALRRAREPLDRG